jgi:hypothetical protein
MLPRKSSKWLQHIHKPQGCDFFAVFLVILPSGKILNDLFWEGCFALIMGKNVWELP